VKVLFFFLLWSRAYPSIRLEPCRYDINKDSMTYDIDKGLGWQRTVFAFSPKPPSFLKLFVNPPHLFLALRSQGERRR